ncbi:MAG: hypothetical protein A3E07_03715 [Candidatus Wildermuthbacteria bacterium RIFCSPHIGHO2_12_FULL_45_9]|uniref:Prepilin-type N-terminal cleavage/methylation domain-containing protein n=1 Tax=Candidatus Wildermuthbacteria bacterium RIFCSPHIGHO2_02_FULL_45_25 TaxID=1802450 RepID=A0A1G2R335_9BACT|nr:MAG: hypothetical protein A2748_02925 [Candidatus Wildermuthbacteria bacterium RIFCSPHIGHO2_01_FULL_45_20]OHA66491.1 MAG: hypothetical protein A3C04_04100 [Candidatus Wildermuthbacteria bacterium RIFCSPHIGHO2_02_FULL_45_25]OHA71471.1 MAG: hypothetical protein A3E07_03715 [Candidatus Wildermuthbacteria bacterium RIFCSPHIGHO2_12_FULL_45_9]
MKTRRGFTIIEILVVVVIIAVVFTGISGLLAFSLRASKVHTSTVEATFLAHETMEALRNFRDGVAWNTDDPSDDYDGIGLRDVNAVYHIAQSVGATPRWYLVSGAETVGIYSRWLEFSNVYRDGNDDIASSGALDADSRKVKVAVTWQEHGITQSVMVENYITNWREP